MEIPVCVTAYNVNPYLPYYVQWKSLFALLRTMEILVTAYGGNPYKRSAYILYALLRTLESPIAVTADNGNP